MPEGVEVEVFRQNITPLERKEITSAKTPIEYKSFLTKRETKKLIGQRVKRIDRHGKRIAIHLDRCMLICTAGMSGYWRFERVHEFRKHDHLILGVAKGFAVYNDARRFGKIKVYPADYGWDDDLGIDGLTNTLLTREGVEKLKRLAGRHPAWPIKVAMLDPSVESSLGNIYVSEMLWRIKVHPLTPVSEIKNWTRLARVTHEVLQAALAGNGTALARYANKFEASNGRPTNGLKIRAYDREDEPCFRCKTLIERSVIGGRASFHCPTCQEEP